MPRRAAKITQADIARAIRAAKAEGANEVTVDGDGNIRISLIVNATNIGGQRDLNGWAPSEPLQRFLKRTESG